MRSCSYVSCDSLQWSTFPWEHGVTFLSQQLWFLPVPQSHSVLGSAGYIMGAKTPAIGLLLTPLPSPVILIQKLVTCVFTLNLAPVLQVRVPLLSKGNLLVVTLTRPPLHPCLHTGRGPCAVTMAHEDCPGWAAQGTRWPSQCVCK